MFAHYTVSIKIRINSLTFTSVILSIATSVLSAPFVSNQLIEGSYGTPYSGYNRCRPGNYGVYRGYGGGLGFGINPIITSNDNFVKSDNFNLNEFDHSKEAAVYVDNTHTKNINNNNFVTQQNDNIAIL